MSIDRNMGNNLVNSVKRSLTCFEERCIKKAPNPIIYLKDKKVSSMLEVYFEINYLKDLYRQGWLLRNIPKDKCESVAEHVYGVTMLSMFIAEKEFPELDIDKIVKMALLHEIGEIYGGDITPGQNVSETDKHEIELDSVIKVLGKLENGQRYIDIWKEFEENKTSEAKFVKQMDKLECGMQSVINSKRGYKGMEEFFHSTLDILKIKELVDLINEAIDLIDV